MATDDLTADELGDALLDPKPALDGDEDDWRERIRESEELRDRRQKHVEDALHGYGGRAYWGGDPKEWCDDPENVAFEYVALMSAACAYDNPIARLGGRRGGQRDRWLLSLEKALASWLRQTRYHRHAEKVATTMCFTPCMSVVRMDVHPAFREADDPVWWPSVHRLGLREGGYDSAAKSWEERRFSYHLASADKEDQLEHARKDAKKSDDDPTKEGWDVEALEHLVVGAGIDKLDSNVPGGGWRKKTDVTWYEVHCPYDKVDRAHTSRLGFHGVIRTLGFDGTGAMMELCAPRDYFGPRGGPHTLFGGYYVPDQALELSPLTATWAQQRDLNDIARANNKSARDWKRILVGSDQDFISAVKKSGHDSALYHKGFTPDRAAVFEYGGLSDQGMAQEARAREQTDRVLGMSESRRGRAEADTTATAEKIAAMSSQTREGFLVKKFTDASEEEISKIAHFMVMHSDVAVVIDETDEQTAFVWLGGERSELEAKARIRQIGFIPDGEEGEGQRAVYAMPKKKSRLSRFDELELTIDIGSTGQKSAEQLHAEGLELMQVVDALTTMAMTKPHARVRLLAQEMAKKLNVPELPDMIDYELGRAIAFKMMQAEATPETPPEKQPEVRFGTDVGIGDMPKFKGGAGPPGSKPMAMNGSSGPAKSPFAGGAGAAAGGA